VAEIVYPPVVVVLKTFWKYLGLKFDFKGDHNIPREGGAILAMNHIGYLDFALIGTAALPVKRYLRFMAKKEIFENKIAGPLMRGMHHISVDRSSGSASFVAALRALKSGAVRLAMGAGVPVIPAVVWGSQRIWTKKVKRDLKRNKYPISVTFGEPLYFTKTDDVEEGEAQLRAAMQALLLDVQSHYPDSHEGARWAPIRLGGSAPAPLN